MKPEDVLHNWSEFDGINNSELDIKKPTSGLLNKTFLIRLSGKLFVLQCVHPAVSMDGAMNNYFHVTQFLDSIHLPTQLVLPTKNSKLWIEDNTSGWRWRLLLGVEGEVYNQSSDINLASEAGKLLGFTDAILNTYPKDLEQGRSSHKYELQIEKLAEHRKTLSEDLDPQIREASQLLHEQLPTLLLPDDLPKRIVHADPKISNYLFTKERKGICMIDFDTLQILSPLFEIADAIRSWCGGLEDDPNNSFHGEIYSALLSGYLANSKGLLSEREQSLIPQACKLVMLGLTARFLIDYVEDSYFGWNETKYKSRKDHNKARVLGQLSLYQSYLKFQ